MAHYKSEITKWSYILLDKFFLDGAFLDKHSLFDPQESYALLRFEDGMSLTEFSLYYNVERKKSTAFLQRLLREGLVKKVDDSEDARKKLLFLTPRGVEEQKRLKETLEAQFDRILGDMTYNDSVGILKFISKLNQMTVEKYKVEDWQEKKVSR